MNDQIYRQSRAFGHTGFYIIPTPDRRNHIIAYVTEGLVPAGAKLLPVHGPYHSQRLAIEVAGRRGITLSS
jgi:hypothetical protein